MSAKMLFTALIVGVFATSPALAENKSPVPNVAATMMDPIAAHQTMCDEHHAHAAGKLAYLEARLDLSDAQKPAWQHWKAARQASAEQLWKACHQAKPGFTLPLPERQAQHLQMMSLMQQGLQSEQPALTALYATLTEAQKKVLDQQNQLFGEGRHHMGQMGEGSQGHGRHHGDMMGHPGWGMPNLSGPANGTQGG